MLERNRVMEKYLIECNEVEVKLLAEAATLHNMIENYSLNNQEYLSLAINCVQQELNDLGRFGQFYFSYYKRKIFIKYDVTNYIDREIIFKFGKLCHEKYIPISMSLNQEMGIEFITMYKAMGKDVETIEDLVLPKILMNEIEYNLVKT